MANLSPLRRGWVQEFLRSAYRSSGRKTREMCLRAVGRFDHFLAETAEVGHGQWSLVTPDHVETYLASRHRFQLEAAKQFFKWLRARKHTDYRLASTLPTRRHLVRLRVLPLEQVVEHYRQWTAVDADPREALVGLLALVHCLRNSQIRYLRLDDVLPNNQIRIGARVIDLAPPLGEVLTRYLTWRSGNYHGPSPYLFVTSQSRLHDRPVSSVWFQYDLLHGVAVASLRQSAIQHLVQGVDCDGMQLAAFTGLSLGAIGTYMTVFGRPGPWPPYLTDASG